MTDYINGDGLTVSTYTELVNNLTTGMTNIYAQDGNAINFSSETTDGQLINILAQLGSDMRELITEVYNSFDPDKCSGSVQDSRYALNFITRKGGTFSEIYITVTCDRTVTLSGLDSNFLDPNASSYTVGDDAGNLWYLIETTQITAGSHSLRFRSQNIGAYTPAVGTITNQITKVLGVVSVINSTGASVIGEQQESDAEFRVRRNRSTAINGQNNEDAMEANILNLQDVVDTKVWVNNTSSVDSTGTNPYTIWVIVVGGDNDEIAKVIYMNGGGLDTRGSVTVNWQTTSQQIIPIHFDRPNDVSLFIKFVLKLVGVNITVIDVDGIKKYISDNLDFRLGEDAQTSTITSLAQEAIAQNGGNSYALDVQISTGGTATSSVSGTGITNASVNNSKFTKAVSDTSGSYVFSYDGSKWELSSEEVNLDDYGISITGTPANGDEITVTFTAGTYSDYIVNTSLQNIFKTDEKSIYITDI